MILIDMSQVLASSFYVDPELRKSYSVELLRHYSLNQVASIRRKMKHQFGDLVLCYDGRGKNWRKEIFPYYKANRTKKKEESDIDWTRVYEMFDTIIDEFKQYLPYRQVQVDRAEGDDVIAVLTKLLLKTMPTESGGIFDREPEILIVSSDKDFKQLQTERVKQYSNIDAKFITIDDPAAFKLDLILRGDTGDGVPNFTSRDDFFVRRADGEKQKPITVKKVEIIKAEGIDAFPEFKSYYERNLQMVDLDRIPSDIVEAIETEYHQVNIPHRTRLMSYFMKSGLIKLMDSLTDF